MYVDDNMGNCRNAAGTSVKGRWPQQLYDNYGKNVKLLRCPSDVPETPMTWATDSTNYRADAAPRSYIINGFNDYFSR